MDQNDDKYQTKIFEMFQTLGRVLMEKVAQALD
jgi:hypothetical protein